MFLILTLFTNLWIYKIFFTNFFLGILILISAIGLKKNFAIFLLTFIPLLFFQIKTTQKLSLTAIENDDRRVIDMRLRAYPRKMVRIGHWLEERRESIALARITRNLYENLDLNLFFFANHPRERVGFNEFEKFNFLLLPFFLVGLLKLIIRSSWRIFLFSFFIPLGLLSLIGNHNSLGPFSLFPFFCVSIASGLEGFKNFIYEKK